MPPRHRRVRVVYLTATLVSIHLDSFLSLARSQLRRHSPSQSVAEIGDRNENTTQEPAASPVSDYPNDESADFRLAEDTTTWSSLAIARDNVQQSNPSTQQRPVNVNNNLTEPRIRRNSSVESVANYEGVWVCVALQTRIDLRRTDSPLCSFCVLKICNRLLSYL